MFLILTLDSIPSIIYNCRSRPTYPEAPIAEIWDQIVKTGRQPPYDIAEYVIEDKAST